ncbi:basic proline-rich protein-like [Marmota monax]|uniref:basic proline-rich protein-like n=1 Tax=Marmota monax TaxID=9995 RepID=UPI001EAFC35A|nr:basic proline-rich protein-like [Marmota monax]
MEGTRVCGYQSHYYQKDFGDMVSHSMGTDLEREEKRREITSPPQRGERGLGHQRHTDAESDPQRKRAPANQRGREPSAYWPPDLPVRGNWRAKGSTGGGILLWCGQLESVAEAGLGSLASRAGGRQDGGCGRGSLLFSSPTRPPSPSPPPPSLQERAFAPPPPRLGSLPLPGFHPPAKSLVPVGPAAPAPAPSGPAAAPITSAAGPAPPFGAPGRGRDGCRAGRRGPGSGARPPPAPASAASAVPPPGARWGPSPAAATAAAPGGGGGMEPPPPPLPPRSPAEGREGSAPRQDPPLRPPPATSTPSLAPSLAPRALPLNRSESAKGGNGKKIPPPVPGAAAAGAARRGARSRCRHGAPSPALPHGGGADAAGAPNRNRVCARRSPDYPGPARGGMSPSGELETFGSSACTTPRKSPPPPGPEDKGLAMSVPSPSEDSQGRPASVVCG